MMNVARFILFFFFNDTATTEIYTLSLHDALPISYPQWVKDLMESHLVKEAPRFSKYAHGVAVLFETYVDRKSTRLNSSHLVISYAVFCLKKKKTIDTI